MKLILYLFLLLLLTSCEKEVKFIPTIEYLSMVGEWNNIEGGGNTVILIQKNGMIEINRNDQRSKGINTNYIDFRTNYGSFYGSNWNWIECTDIHKQKVSESISFFVTSNYDTLLTDVGQTDYYNGLSNAIRFIRK